MSHFLQLLQSKNQIQDPPRCTVYCLYLPPPPDSCTDKGYTRAEDMDYTKLEA